MPDVEIVPLGFSDLAKVLSFRVGYSLYIFYVPVVFFRPAME